MSATNNKQQVLLGTELKININISEVGNLTMDDYDFSTEFYCSAKRVLTVKKENAIRLDENNYLFRVDTEEVGAGDLKCKVTAYIPDQDFDDGLRTEVVGVDTGINITKYIQ